MSLKPGFARWQFYFRKLGVTYYWCTKAAGTSISRSLATPLDKKNEHRWFELNKKFNSEGLFSITSCRNPWDRLVSSFFSAKQKNANPSSLIFNQLGLTTGSSFEAFVEAITSTDPDKLNWHVVPQVYLSPKNVDFVIRFEYILYHWKKLQQKFPVGELQITNKSSHNIYLEYYTQKTYDAVGRYYLEDVMRFNYVSELQRRINR